MHARAWVRYAAQGVYLSEQKRTPPDHVRRSVALALGCGFRLLREVWTIVTHDGAALGRLGISVSGAVVAPYRSNVPDAEILSRLVMFLLGL